MSAVIGSRARRRQSAATDERRLIVEQRISPPLAARASILVLSILGALLLGAALLLATGNPPLSVYRQIVDASVGSSLALSQTLEQTTPLILTGLAATVAFRLRVYNIGQDGQLIVGAVCASGFALTVGKHLPAPLLVVATMVVGVLGGTLYALGPGLAAARLKTNVVISTLMLNYIALHLVSYLILDTHSLWRATVSGGGIPEGAQLPAGTRLPLFFQQADIGVLLGVLVAAGVWALMRLTKWGYELRVIGDSPRAARYAGMSVAGKIVTTMCLSGALAGLAGAIQVVNVTQGLSPVSLDPGLGLGYTGIVVAALARLSPVAVVPVAFVMAALLNAGPSLEIAGVPGAIVIVLQGLILLLVGAGQFFFDYRVRRARPTERDG